MAKLFQITRPDGMSTIKLDSEGQATVQYTVKNVSARVIDGRAVLVSLSPKPPDGPVEKGWVKVEGKAEKRFDVNEEQIFTVKITVPPNRPPGSHTFRQDVVWVDKPDEGDQGQTVGFTVPDKPIVRWRPEWWQIGAAVVGALAIIGVVVWLVWPTGIKVPDLHGESVANASRMLTEIGLSAGQIETVRSRKEDADKVVDHTPKAGDRLPSGTAVKLRIGSVLVEVPSLFGKAFDTGEAQKILQDNQLRPGNITTKFVTNVSSGIVFEQKPKPGVEVESNSPVDLFVAAKSVTVPRVQDMTIVPALLLLQSKGLKLEVSGQRTDQPILSQKPLEGTIVEVGSVVNVHVPGNLVKIDPLIIFKLEAMPKLKALRVK